MPELTEWRPFPGRLPEEQIFVIGDVHGRDRALDAVISRIAEVPRAAPVRRLVSLGDLIDRGHGNLPVIRTVLAGREAAAVDEVDLLPGNHELMLLDVLDDPSWAGFYSQVGGLSLIDELDPEGEATTNREVSELLRTGLPDGFVDRIRAAPSHLRLGDLVLVHGGLYPSRDPQVQAAFLAQGRVATQKEHWAWIRDPFLDWTGGWDAERRVVVMHGHSCVVERPVRPGVFFEGADLVGARRRINLDAGSAACEQVGYAELIGGSEPVYRVGMVGLDPVTEDG